MQMPKISKQQHGSDNKNGSTGGLLVSSQLIAENEDILSQILLPLPVKSLLRFKSVSKDWLSLISSPHFRRCKSKQLSKNISGLILEIEEWDGSKFVFKYEYLSLDEKDEQAVSQSQGTSPLKRLDFLHSGAIRVLEHCNGLLLCSDAFGLECKYYVFNPSTNEYTTVSLNRVLESGKVHKVKSVSLAFDPRESLHYKLICLYLFDLDDDSYYEVGVYSSENDLLRIIGCPIQRSVIYFHKGVYWNGAVNWVGSEDGGLYFNVEEERWGTLPLPPVLLHGGGEGSEDWEWEEYGRLIMYYGESNDHFHLIEQYTVFATEIDVYELDKGYSGWFVRFRVDLQPVFSFFQNLSYKEVDFPCIACVVRKEEVEKSFLVVRSYGKAFRLSCEDMSLSMISDSASSVEPEDHFSLKTFQVIESLYQL